VAQQEIEEACRLLIDPSPENLDRCSTVLTGAISRLSQSRPPASEARTVRVLVKRVVRLLEAAASYRYGWRRVLQAMSAGGYTPAGDPAVSSEPRRIWMEG
jgi:hypothetical protein